MIAAGRLDEVVPIEPATMADRRIVQWDKDSCADAGLLKAGAEVARGDAMSDLPSGATAT